MSETITLRTLFKHGSTKSDGEKKGMMQLEGHFEILA